MKGLLTAAALSGKVHFCPVHPAGVNESNSAAQ
jgi:hypothetical protein